MSDDEASRLGTRWRRQRYFGTVLLAFAMCPVVFAFIFQRDPDTASFLGLIPVAAVGFVFVVLGVLNRNREIELTTHSREPVADDD
ncbi:MULTISPECIES: hypothetical protein [unclassified Actinobaculum]|uniref:hypothetical protein n=1 Tax=unclassified Actinobaculum TaxID=2609299 RepID=UPI000D529645|nr:MULTISPECIES: hypothetical protein [unclassified Actinobaculum]AWE41671.1 hypothetical protein DDD63_01610 [Actinobaculum sp. 313]RTE49292.1 hypothetical protein EKN07_06920 [Actinobaculum sp. 352]